MEIILGIVAIAAILLGLKHFFLLSIPASVSFVSATVEEFPEANINDFTFLTSSLESLGFTQISQHRLQLDGRTPSPVFIRLFANSQLRCFAEAYQIFPKHTQPTAVRFTITSIFDQGCEYDTINHNLDSVPSIVLSAPNSLWSCHPDLSPSELLQVHLQERQQIMQERRLDLTADLTTETFLASANRAASEQAEALKQRSTFKVIGDAFRKPPTKWPRGISK